MNKLPVPTEEMEAWHFVPYYGWCARVDGAGGGFVTLRSISRGLLNLARQERPIADYIHRIRMEAD